MRSEVLSAQYSVFECRSVERLLLEKSDASSGAPTEYCVLSTPSLPGALDRAALVEELEHVALMRLIPGNLHGRHRPEIEAVNQRRLEQLPTQLRILGDRTHYKGRANLLKHLTLWHL